MLEQQMELFEDGGLKDEGGEVDEVSGNEVPIGGTKKGVRDDVPAMVSEGEFVFPEDVTRYIGLDKLMQMRQEAKMGLKRMEAMGQMGNGDEATMPDDMPFSVADLIVVSGDTGEELEMQDGGFVVRPTTARRTEPQPTYTQPTDQDAQQPVFKTTRRLLPEREEPQPIDLDFSGVMGEGKISFKDYRNEKGENILIPFIGDSPVFPIPEGYTLYTGEDSSANTNEVASKVNEISQAQEKDKYEVPDFLKPQPPEPKNWATMPTDKLIDELSSVTGTSRLIAKGAMLLMGPVGIAGSFMMKDQDKKIVAAIDAALARGGLSSEDKATLTAAKEELTKSGMLSFLDPIINGVANVLGVPEEQVSASVNANVQSGAVDPEPEPEVVETDPRIDVSTQPVLDAPYPFPDDPPPSVLSRSVDTTIKQPTIATDALPSKTTITEDIAPRTSYEFTAPIVQPDALTVETTPVIPDKVPLDTVPFKYSDITPAKITTGVSEVTTPSPRLGYESGQDVQQSVPRYLQGAVGGQPEFYSPPQIVTTQAQTEAPSAPQLAQPEAFTATLPKRDPSVDPTGVGKFPPLSPEAPEAVSPLPPKVDTVSASKAPSYATMPMGEAGRGMVSTAKGRDIDTAFDPIPTKSAAPDTSIRPKARPKTVETKDKTKAKKKDAPKRDTGSKSNRLDKSNPNTEINFNEHLAEWEKNMARSDPALAQHFITTANRRQNDIEKTGKDPEDKISAKKTDESGGLGGWIKKQFGKKKGGLATRY